MGSAAKRSSRRCFTRVSVTAPTAPKAALPTKFAVGEKHIRGFSAAKITSAAEERKSLFSPTGRARIGRRTGNHSAGDEVFHPNLGPRSISASTHFRANDFSFQLSLL